jgi:putative phage-type endonuclease
MERFDAEPGSEKYNKITQNKVTSSEIGVVTGILPESFMTRLELWAQKTGRQEREDLDTPGSRNFKEHIWFGQNVEPIVIDRYSQAFPSLHVEQNHKLMVSDEHPFHAATPDGRAGPKDVDGKEYEFDRGLEAKTGSNEAYMNKPEEYQWGDEDTDEVPMAIICQCQWQMGVTGFDRVDIPAYLIENGKPEFHRYIVKRNDELIETLRQDAQEFLWYVENDERPEELSEKERREYIQQLHWDHETEEYEYNEMVDMIVGKINELREIKNKKEEEHISAIEDEIDRQKEALKNMFEKVLDEGKNPQGLKGDKHYFNHKKQERFYLDKEGAEWLKKNHPEIYEEYVSHSKWRGTWFGQV